MLLRNVLRSTLAVALIIGTGHLAVAQYGGGMGGGTGGSMPGSPTYNTHRSYSNKGAIISGIAAGAAAVGGLIYWKHHNHTKTGRLRKRQRGQAYKRQGPPNLQLV